MQNIDLIMYRYVPFLERLRSTEHYKVMEAPMQYNSRARNGFKTQLGAVATAVQ